jgi:hypothetical protein
MATVTNKRKALSFEEKVKLIGEIENESKNFEVCVNYKIKKIWKDGTKIIIIAFEQNGSRIRRF